MLWEIMSTGRRVVGDAKRRRPTPQEKTAAGRRRLIRPQRALVAAASLVMTARQQLGMWGCPG
jgi:hypothetical protein